MIKKVVVMFLLILLLLVFTYQILPRQTIIVEIPGRIINFPAIPSVFIFLYVYKMEANSHPKPIIIIKEAL